MNIITNKTSIIFVAAFLIIIAVGFLVPLSSVEAQGGGIVPTCTKHTTYTNVLGQVSTINDPSGQPIVGVCGFCDFFALIANIFGWLLIVGVAVGALAVVYGGILYIISQGDEGKATTAKEVITKAIIGIGIMAVSYIIVLTIMHWLVDPQFIRDLFGSGTAGPGGFFQITCS